MTIRYEANPPKTDTDKSIAKFVAKIKIISKKCDAIHLTENVLGHQRVSPIKIGRIIRKEIPNLPITASLRVRDKNEEEIFKFVNDCIGIGFSGILVLMGDPSQEGRQDSGQFPSRVVKRLKEKGIDSKIDLYLSIPNRPDFAKIGKKLEAKPVGFMTQAVQNIRQVQDIAENLGGFAIVPIILFPSEKNRKSAEFLNIDLASYGRDFEELVQKARRITGDILITSPSDFGGLSEFLEKLARL